MKASRKPNEFSPVYLTLETQAEVDAIYAVLDHAKLGDALGFTDQYKALQPFKSYETEKFHVKINGIFKK